jgi:hypothetical protein
MTRSDASDNVGPLQSGSPQGWRCELWVTAQGLAARSVGQEVTLTGVKPHRQSRPSLHPAHAGRGRELLGHGKAPRTPIPGGLRHREGHSPIDEGPESPELVAVRQLVRVTATGALGLRLRS